MDHSIPTLTSSYQQDLLANIQCMQIANVTDANKLYSRGLIADHELAAYLISVGAYVQLEFCGCGQRAEARTGRCDVCQACFDSTPVLHELDVCRCYVARQG